MTFRWKLALALACVSAVAIGGSAVAAYALTDHHLAVEVAQSLQEAAGEIALDRPPADGGPPPVPPTPPLDARIPPTSLGLLGLVVIQRIDASGEVIGQPGPVTLPVDASDRALASGGGQPVVRTSEADGQSYRIETVSIPGGGAFEIGRDLGEDEALLGALRWLFTLVGLAIMVLAALAGWMIAGRITSRLARLAANAERVAETGRLELAVDTSGRDEVGRLSRSFSLMVQALARSRGQQQVLAQNAEHELRTPLTSLRTNIDLLRRHPDLSAADKDAVLCDLDGELAELTALVDELVELTSDAPSPEGTGAVRLHELARRVAERTRTRTGREVTVEAVETVVEGDVRHLERAMTNLVDNAAKFSPAGSPIELVVEPGRVEVRDRGPGIPEADAAYVFDRFYRAESARSAPGSGLGLAIVRRVAEMHGGTAFVHPRAGGGACIGFSLDGAADAARDGTAGG